MSGLVIGHSLGNLEPERRGDLVRYFKIEAIQAAIACLQEYDSSWIVPAFVFAANDIGEEGGSLTRQGTDKFLDKFFHGRLMGLPPAANGKNLMRPRFRDVEPWQIDREFMGDYIVRQGTKAWANLYSSRGYRDMKMRGEIEMNGPAVRLESIFQKAFEDAVPDKFRFEHFLVWIFAFSGFPTHVSGWKNLLAELHSSLDLAEGFRSAYGGRFIVTGDVRWPKTQESRPTDVEFSINLAPKLVESLRIR